MLVDRPELDPIGVGLLEMVPDELIDLGEFGTALFEPVGKPLVQLGPCLLRQRVVGCVADQQVAEPEGVLSLRSAADPDG